MYLGEINNKIGVQKMFRSKEICFQKKEGPQKNWSQKFGQNWVSNTWDIADIDIFSNDICWVEKCHCDSWPLLKMSQGSYF